MIDYKLGPFQKLKNSVDYYDKTGVVLGVLNSVLNSIEGYYNSQAAQEKVKLARDSIRMDNYDNAVTLTGNLLSVCPVEEFPGKKSLEEIISNLSKEEMERFRKQGRN